MSLHGNTFWESQRNNVGYALLSKMGWEEGTGLGKSRKGSTKCVRVKKKRDNGGIGSNSKAKEDEETWKASTSLFNGVLQKLQRIQDGIGTKEDLDSAKEEVGASIAVKQYSARSKLYTRFTKAKDVSRYSKKDMDAILGRKSSNPGKKEKNSNLVEGTETNEFSFSTSNQSMDAYFQSRMALSSSKSEDKSTSQSQQDIFDRLQSQSLNGKGGLGSFNSNVATNENVARPRNRKRTSEEKTGEKKDEKAKKKKNKNKDQNRK